MTVNTDEGKPMEAMLLVTAQCPHCASVLASLAELVKEGRLGYLQVYNLDQHPEIAQEHGVRSVPWVRIGPFELTGAQSKSTLLDWIKKAGSPEGMADYFAELISDRQVMKVVDLLEHDARLFPAIFKLLDDSETELGVRVGIGVVMEAFAGTDELKKQFPRLLALAGHHDERVRGDACYYLGLTESDEAIPALQACLQDPSADVRESAEDALESLAGTE